jgi:predicted lipoprotein with Yx(FWY)xxD motif
VRTRIVLLGATLILGLAACGGQSGKGHDGATRPTDMKPVSIAVGQSSFGPILTDQDGRTLYAFTKDQNGDSSCVGQCVATWPALVSRRPATARPGVESKLMSQTTRSEGIAQTTYNKWPLYYYAGDAGPGDVDGQGVDGVWFVVGADGKLIKSES